MKRKPIEQKKNVSQVNTHVNIGSTEEKMAAPDKGGFLPLIKTVVFSVLLFLAMTVQTGRMSVILCVLAVLSLIGKKPFARFKALLCVPVLGLLAFAMMEGAAAIYSPFDAYAVSEYYKFIAAFALSVILLARFDRGDVPGLVWGLCAVSAAIGLLSVDSAVPGPLFSGFNALMNALGADFSSILEVATTNRINGLYNDANVTGCIFGMGTLLALYLAGHEKSRRNVFLACMLLGVNAMSFFLSLSRGAILFFAIACLLWLVLAGKGERLVLFFRMAVSAAVVVALSIPAASALVRGSILPTFLTVLSGGLIFLLDVLLVRRLAELCGRHIRIAAVSVGAVLVLCAAYAVAGFVVTGPATLGESGYLERGTALSAGDYTLAVDGDALSRIQVLWRDRTGALMNQWDVLYDGDPAAVSFTVPADGGSVLVTFRGEPETQLHSAEFSDGTALAMDYPLLPGFITERLQDSLSNSFSTWARLQYIKDAVTIFTRSPVIGHGLAATENLYRSVQPYAYESKYVHCQPLQVLCETGLVGLAAFLALVLGSAWLCLRALRRGGETAPLAAMLAAVWVLMNGHSLMEINFSIRGFQCFAYILLLLPVLLYAQPLVREEAGQKRTSVFGGLLMTAFALYLAVFGGLLESHRMAERTEYATNSVYEYLDMLKSCVSRDVFVRSNYELTYVSTAVQLKNPTYNGTMFRYVSDLRESGTYENCSGLARYYYLPREEWSELFACSREGIHQVRSSADGWNLQMVFYREEVLPAMGAENMDAFLEGVIALGDALDALNGEDRLEIVELTAENQTFLKLCRSLKEEGISGEAAYILLSGVLEG